MVLDRHKTQCFAKASSTHFYVPTGPNTGGYQSGGSGSRAAALEAPRRRRPSRLAGRNGRPTNYATNQIPARSTDRREAAWRHSRRHWTLATRSRRDNLNCGEKNGLWRRKKGTKIGYGGISDRGISMLRLTQLRIRDDCLIRNRRGLVDRCLRPSVHSGKPWHGRSW